jgi:hypothetical protein
VAQPAIRSLRTALSGSLLVLTEAARASGNCAPTGHPASSQRTRLRNGVTGGPLAPSLADPRPAGGKPATRVAAHRGGRDVAPDGADLSWPAHRTGTSHRIAMTMTMTMSASQPGATATPRLLVPLQVRGSGF